MARLVRDAILTVACAASLLFSSQEAYAQSAVEAFSGIYGATDGFCASGLVGVDGGTIQLSTGVSELVEARCETHLFAETLGGRAIEVEFSCEGEGTHYDLNGVAAVSTDGMLLSLDGGAMLYGRCGVPSSAPNEIYWAGSASEDQSSNADDYEALFFLANRVCRQPPAGLSDDLVDYACELRAPIVEHLSSLGLAWDSGEQVFVVRSGVSSSTGDVRRLRVTNGSEVLDAVYWINGEYIGIAIAELSQILGSTFVEAERSHLIQIADLLTAIDRTGARTNPMRIQANGLDIAIQLEDLDPERIDAIAALPMAPFLVDFEDQTLILRLAEEAHSPVPMTPVDTNQLLQWSRFLAAAVACEFRQIEPAFANVGGTDPGSNIVDLLVAGGMTETSAYALLGRTMDDAFRVVAEIHQQGALPTHCSDMLQYGLSLPAQELLLLSSLPD